MQRQEFQNLAEERMQDAIALLSVHRWPAAYYLVGYAVECALKSCVLNRMAKDAAVIFREKKFSENCWTHSIGALFTLADLDQIRDVDCLINPTLGKNWLIVKDWKETSRYEKKSRLEAEKMFEAVADAANGVLPWIKHRW